MGKSNHTKAIKEITLLRHDRAKCHRRNNPATSAATSGNAKLLKIRGN